MISSLEIEEVPEVSAALDCEPGRSVVTINWTGCWASKKAVRGVVLHRSGTSWPRTELKGLCQRQWPSRELGITYLGSQGPLERVLESSRSQITVRTFLTTLPIVMVWLYILQYLETHFLAICENLCSHWRRKQTLDNPSILYPPSHKNSWRCDLSIFCILRSPKMMEKAWIWKFKKWFVKYLNIFKGGLLNFLDLAQFWRPGPGENWD